MTVVSSLIRQTLTSGWNNWKWQLCDSVEKIMKWNFYKNCFEKTKEMTQQWPKTERNWPDRTFLLLLYIERLYEVVAPLFAAPGKLSQLQLKDFFFFWPGPVRWRFERGVTVATADAGQKLLFFYCGWNHVRAIKQPADDSMHLLPALNIRPTESEASLLFFFFFLICRWEQETMVMK